MSFALIFDGLAVCILLLFGIRGTFKGFLTELIGLVGFFASLYCAWNFHELLATPLMQYFPKLDSNIVTLICGVAIFLVIALGFTILQTLLTKIVRVVGLSFLNHLLGALVGAVKTFLILLAIYGVCSTFSGIIPTAWMSESYAMRVVSVTWPPVKEFLEENHIMTSGTFTIDTHADTKAKSDTNQSQAQL